MASTQQEYAEKRMHQKWYDLVMAEEKGAPTQVLERLYGSYIQAVEEYNRCSALEQSEPQIQPLPVRVAPTTSQGRRTKKAS